MRFIFLLLLAGCSFKQAEKFILPEGEAMICMGYEQKECGMSLKQCGQDYSVDFECMSDVIYKGPGDHFEPDVYDEPAPPAPPLVEPAKKEVKKKKGKK